MHDTLAERLRDQNNGTTWTDCNLRARPRPHHWKASPVDGYWDCARCPVSTRARTPAPFLVYDRLALRGES